VTSHPSLLVTALNAALGLELADFAEARAFINSPEGSEMLDAWLASQPDDEDNGTATESALCHRVDRSACPAGEARTP